MSNYPTLIYKEEGMREGMQIENSNIPVDDKVALLDALSETGLKKIVVGSFVSPKWTPQMERIDEIVARRRIYSACFEPKRSRKSPCILSSSNNRKRQIPSLRGAHV